MLQTLWFWLVGFMLIMYVVLDGFDLGAGALHPFVAKSDAERRNIFKAIGPVWDGNEVWLIAAGGSLFFAFPLLYATSFSGFYLPLMLVLWLLIIRGVSIELRSHLSSPLWRDFWDGAFFIGSALLALFFGVALGNVVRGVPIDATGNFFVALWTTFSPSGPNPGVLDWYTVTIGLLSLCALSAHGAAWISLKTVGALSERCKRVGFALWGVTVALTAIATLMTFSLRPELWGNFRRWPLGLLLPLLAIGALIAMGVCLRRGREKRAFVASCAYLAGMLASTVYALYPLVLPAVEPSRSLTVFNASASRTGLLIGLGWWSIGMLLALTYFVGIYWLFRGKIPDHDGHY
jgi:cytochrome d ubiquinol oxidase subunit II